jgi:hypothetical protein
MGKDDRGDLREVAPGVREVSPPYPATRTRPVNNGCINPPFWWWRFEFICICYLCPKMVYFFWQNGQPFISPDESLRLRAWLAG